MAISTNPKPTMYRNLYENTGTDNYYKLGSINFYLQGPYMYVDVFSHVSLSTQRGQMKWNENSYIMLW